MTLQELDTALKKACPETYETAAPQGKHRYVVWNSYRRSSMFGDDRNQVDVPKVQIDIITNIHNDKLVNDVCEALGLLDLPYSVESEGYDDEYSAYRTILQLVVV